jgi:hypothetical protein
MHCTYTPFIPSIHLIDTRSEMTNLCAHVPNYAQEEGGMGNEAAGANKNRGRVLAMYMETKFTKNYYLSIHHFRSGTKSIPSHSVSLHCKVSIRRTSHAVHLFLVVVLRVVDTNAVQEA